VSVFVFVFALKMINLGSVCAPFYIVLTNGSTDERHAPKSPLQRAGTAHSTPACSLFTKNNASERIVQGYEPEEHRVTTNQVAQK
jgi:hypothetical protein